MNPWIDVALWFVGAVLFAIAGYRQGRITVRAGETAWGGYLIVLLAFTGGLLVGL